MSAPTTRAKVQCFSSVPDEQGTTFGFHAVYGDSPENKTWSKWTPSLSLSMHVTNPEVKFETGKAYYLDFTPAT